MTRTLRTPRDLQQLREQRARRCSAKVEGRRRCSLPWRIAKRLDLSTDDESLLCTRHARAKSVELWTADEEAREVKYLRQIQLDYDRMMR